MKRAIVIKFDMRRISNAYHWLACRLWRRWNVVKIRTLSPDYHDPDETLLHAAFAIFCRFVERSDWEGLAWDDDADNPKGHTATIKGEIVDLYRWWTEIYPKRDSTAPLWNCTGMTGFVMGTPEYDAHYKTIYRPQADAYHAWTDACDKEDEDNLIRLVKIRPYLWT